MGLSGKTRLISLVLVLATAITFIQFCPAFGAGQSFAKSGNFRASRMQGQPFFALPFHRFGLVGLDGFGDQSVIIIQQFQSAPIGAPSEPVENKIYVQPRWVDGGYGVQVLEPGYWTVPK